MTLLEECRKNQNDWFEQSKKDVIEFILHEFGKGEKFAEIIYGSGYREFEIEISKITPCGSNETYERWWATMGECCASRIKEFLISEGFYVTTQTFGIHGNMKMIISAY